MQHAYSRRGQLAVPRTASLSFTLRWNLIEPLTSGASLPVSHSVRQRHESEFSRPFDGFKRVGGLAVIADDHTAFFPFVYARISGARAAKNPPAAPQCHGKQFRSSLRQ